MSLSILWICAWCPHIDAGIAIDFNSSDVHVVLLLIMGKDNKSVSAWFPN